MTLYWLKGVVPREITMGDIYHSIWPFVIIQIACLVLMMYVPQISLWLPSMLGGMK